MPSTRGIMFWGCLSAASVPSGCCYLINGLSSLDETYRKYSLVPTYDLIRFWRSKVKVTARCQGGKVIHVDAVVSRSIFCLHKSFVDSISISCYNFNTVLCAINISVDLQRCFISILINYRSASSGCL